jgi:sugar fermentation stimulation protein A
MPLQPGRLIQRYKRFLADVELADGTVITAHCANSGSMITLKDPGMTVWVAPIPDHVERKLRYDWYLVEQEGTMVGINTSMPNRIVEQALRAQYLPAFEAYTNIRREVPYGTSSRIDFFLQEPGLPNLYLEVKTVTLREGDCAVFPDAVTSRGAKQLGEMMDQVAQGHRAAVLYVILRNDCQRFDVAAHIDPTYAQVVRQAHQVGVEFWAHACEVTPQGIVICRDAIKHA